MKRSLMLMILSATVSAIAQTPPIIQSVYPLSGPASGWSKVTIEGTGFSTCVCSPPVPPRVFFGETEAIRVNHLSEVKLEALAPPHTGGFVPMRVVLFDNTQSKSSVAYLFDVEDGDGVERVLIPLFTPPIAGQNGAEFHTELRIVNERESPVTVHGLTTNGTPFIVNGEVTPSPIGSPARFITIASKEHDQLWMNLRAYDTSRAADNFGTQIPLPREKDFIREEMVLSNIPTDPKFRSTLRIYSTTDPGTISMRIVAQGHTETKQINLRAGANEYEPAYAVFTDFPVNVGPIRVEISSPPQELIFPPSSVPPPMWAFISLTNNDMQMITTITP
ncbi:MAG TPA: IPT/TIG domain-containing protein [Thermoanaerobaculia bacterium]